MVNPISTLPARAAFRPSTCLIKRAYCNAVLAESDDNPRTTNSPASYYDCVIIGGGHNGLVASAYLQEKGLSTCILERRPMIGGAAVTEEIVPGFKFSRASYLLSLLRPKVMKELKLQENGLKVYSRNPSSFTPMEDGRYLMLGMDSEENKREIAKFSVSDAEKFEAYEQFLDEMVQAIDPLLDNPPADVQKVLNGTLQEKISALPSVSSLAKSVFKLGTDIPSFFEILTAPAEKILCKWFESEPLRSTLATDAVIGAMVSPKTPGSGYVLFHHVMGELDGVRGAWGFVEGGMGSVSNTIAKVAKERGSEIFTNSKVERILIDTDGHCRGIRLADGHEVNSKYVLSNCTPKETFLNLVGESNIGHHFKDELGAIEYNSPVTKINVAVNALPSFSCRPNVEANIPMSHHQCTIHIGCQTMEELNQAYKDAQCGIASKKPVIEMCIPSALDPTISPPGQHVISIFAQYTPYKLADGTWDDPGRREEFADRVFTEIEKHAPGFKASIVGADILTPVDIERIFGLTGGNIFHGSMSLDQLYFLRPTASSNGYKSPIKGLFMCGSGAHPGGGVMGAAGRNCALQVLKTAKV